MFSNVQGTVEEFQVKVGKKKKSTNEHLKAKRKKNPQKDLMDLVSVIPEQLVVSVSLMRKMLQNQLSSIFWGKKKKSVLIDSFTFQLGILLLYRHSFNHTLQAANFTDVTM